LSVGRRSIAAFVAVAVGFGFAAGARAAERTLDETTRYPCSEGKNLVVDVTGLDTEIRTADVSEIEVTVKLKISGVGADKADRWIASRTPQIDDGDDELRIVSRPGKPGFLALGHFTARSRLRIVTPTTVIPDITTTSGGVRIKGDFPLADPMRLRTATGTLEFEGAAHALDVRSASGDVRLDVLRPFDRLFVRTSSGDLSLAGGARDVEVDTASGNVWLTNLSGNAAVDTSTGKITLRWDHLGEGDEVRARSASGRVSLTVPESVRAGGTLTTTGGTLRCDLPGLASDEGRVMTLQGDGPTITAETASGELILAVGDPWDASRKP
jgi:hypothetical protein